MLGPLVYMLLGPLVYLLLGPVVYLLLGPLVYLPVRSCGLPSVRPLVYLLPKNFKLFVFSNLLTISEPDEGFSRNESCTIN
jgi:hypothetical protein